ncbi:MAG: TIGR02449 family protein [Cellvibrionales bacterium]|nr:TIGR02449 family protein [Cellvibrionales bacterium]
MDDKTIEMLEGQIDALIQRCEELMTENQHLKENEQQHQDEKKILMQRNESAATKISAMIARLKTLENNA